MPTRNYSLRLGDPFVMECDPIGPVDVKVVEVDPPRRLVWRWIASFGPTTVTFHVSPEGAGTRLRFSQHYAVELTDDDYGIYNFNWGYYLESLRLLCAAGQGKPYQPTES